MGSSNDNSTSTERKNDQYLEKSDFLKNLYFYTMFLNKNRALGLILAQTNLHHIYPIIKNINEIIINLTLLQTTMSHSCCFICISLSINFTYE